MCPSTNNMYDCVRISVATKVESVSCLFLATAWGNVEGAEGTETKRGNLTLSRCCSVVGAVNKPALFPGSDGDVPHEEAAHMHWQHFNCHLWGQGNRLEPDAAIQEVTPHFLEMNEGAEVNLSQTFATKEEAAGYHFDGMQRRQVDIFETSAAGQEQAIQFLHIDEGCQVNLR